MSIPCQFYARLERKGNILCGECLEDHLVNTAIASTILYKRLAGGDDYGINAVTIAALIHDIGKLVYNISKSNYIDSLIEGRIEGSLTFPYHEILSAVLLGYYVWISEENILEEALLQAAIRAVLMHHQGLRGVSAQIYQRGLAELITRYSSLRTSEKAKLDNALINLFERLAKRAESIGTQNKPAKLLKSIKEYLGSNKLTLATALENASILLPEWMKLEDPREAEKARLITGILMLADNAIARESLEKCDLKTSSSLYVKEALWLYKKLKAMKTTN